MNKGSKIGKKTLFFDPLK